MIEIVPFSPQHPMFMKLRDQDRWLEETGYLKVWSGAHGRLAKGITIFERDPLNVIAVGGIDTIWGGLGEVWGLLANGFERYKFTVGKSTRRIIDDALNGGGFHRLQAVIDPEDKAAVTFIEWLGFDREATLKKYDPFARDQYLYARVK